MQTNAKDVGEVGGGLVWKKWWGGERESVSKSGETVPK